MTDNPYTAPPNRDNDSETLPSDDVSDAKAAYNVLSDTVTGVNVRGSDNKFQLKFITVSVFVLAAVGALLALLNSNWRLPWYGGAMFGAFAGLIFGVLTSGIVLMIYRASRHLAGKHD